MKKIFTFLSILICLYSYAQTPTNVKTRFPGIWYSSKDTANNKRAADSIALIANRNDSSLYFRWKGYYYKISSARDTAAAFTPYHAAYYNATFDTSTRVLTLFPITGFAPKYLTIPRGGSVTGINSIAAIKSSNLITLLADNGTSTIFSINTTDSLQRILSTDTAAMLNGYYRKTGGTISGNISATGSITASGNMFIGAGNSLFADIMSARSGASNATVNTSSNGTRITRDNSGTAVPLTVSQLNTSSVSNILNLDSRGSNKGFFDYVGTYKVQNPDSSLLTMNNNAYMIKGLTDSTHLRNYTIAQARALSGRFTPIKFYITDSGQEGIFYKVASDVTSADNTGTILVDANGTRYYRDLSQKRIVLNWFGVDGSYHYGATANDDSAYIRSLRALAFHGITTLSIGKGYYWTSLTATAASLGLKGITIEGAGFNAYQSYGTETYSTHFIYSGSGVMFQNSLPDGTNPDNQIFDGIPNFKFQNITFRALAQNPANNVTAVGTWSAGGTWYYSPNTLAIVDRRGGGFVFNNVSFEGFDTCFYGYNSDFDLMTNVTFKNSVRGVILKGHSDQGNFRAVTFINMYRAIEFYETIQSNWYGTNFITCGTTTINGVLISTGSPSTNSVGSATEQINFRDTWIEQIGKPSDFGDTAQLINSTFEITTSGTYPSDSVNILKLDGIQYLMPSGTIGVPSSGKTADRRQNSLVLVTKGLANLIINDNSGFSSNRSGFATDSAFRIAMVQLVGSSAPYTKISGANAFNYPYINVTNSGTGAPTTIIEGFNKQTNKFQIKGNTLFLDTLQANNIKDIGLTVDGVVTTANGVLSSISKLTSANIDTGRAVAAIISGGSLNKVKDSITALFASGTYTPTVSDIFGTSSLSASVCTYTRIGNIVTVAFEVVGSTSGGTNQFNMSIPLGGNFTATAQACGNGTVGGNVGYNVGSVQANSGTTNVIVTAINGVNTTFGIRGVFQYQLQ